MRIDPSRLCLVVAATAIAIALAASAYSASAQEGATVVRPVPSSSKVKKSADTFTVDIVGENLSNVGAFQIVLTFDSDVIRATSIVKTDFLGSSGREVVCPEEQAAVTTQSVSILCVTPGGEAAGVEGTGSLATVTFEPVGEGTSPLTLTVASLSSPQGGAVSSSAADGEVKITSEGPGLVWIAIVVAVVGALLVVGAAYLFRRRARRRQIASDLDPLPPSGG